MQAHYVSLVFHIIWSTRDRRPLLVGAREVAVHATIVAKAHQSGCKVLALGGVDDHVHVLLSMRASVSLSQVVRHMKGASSHLANHAEPAAEKFAWQEGYSAFSVDHANVERVRAYIVSQRDHHAGPPSRLEPTSQK